VQWSALVFSFPVLSLIQTYLSIRKEIVKIGGIEPHKIHAPIPPREYERRGFSEVSDEQGNWYGC
jgi:hypothetical protein